MAMRWPTRYQPRCRPPSSDGCAAMGSDRHCVSYDFGAEAHKLKAGQPLGHRWFASGRSLQAVLHARLTTRRQSDHQRCPIEHASQSAATLPHDEGTSVSPAWLQASHGLAHAHPPFSVYVNPKSQVADMRAPHRLPVQAERPPQVAALAVLDNEHRLPQVVTVRLHRPVELRGGAG